MLPIQTINRLMPFLIMTYLMTSITHLSATGWTHLPFGGSSGGNGASLINNLKHEFAQFAKSGDHTFAYYDETQYPFVGYPTP